MEHRRIVALQCNDRPGLVAEIAGKLASVGGNIVEAQQFNDQSNERFFMRIEFDLPGSKADDLRLQLQQMTEVDRSDWRQQTAGSMSARCSKAAVTIFLVCAIGRCSRSPTTPGCAPPSAWKFRLYGHPETGPRPSQHYSQ